MTLETREVNLNDYLPEIYLQMKEMKEISDVETGPINSLWQNVYNIYYDGFIMIATEYSIARRERYLGIVPGPNDTLEDRRFAILARYQEQAPYTYKTLRRLLDSLLGASNYTMTRDIPNNTLAVKVDLSSASMYNTVEELLERIVPVNMALSMELLYNTHSQLSAFTHNQLSAYTHNQLREESL